MPVRGGTRLRVEDALEHVLHLGDGRADGDLAAQPVAQVMRGRQVVGMGVGFRIRCTVRRFSCTKATNRSAEGGALRPDFRVVVGTASTMASRHSSSDHVAHGPVAGSKKPLTMGFMDAPWRLWFSTRIYCYIDNILLINGLSSG